MQNISFSFDRLFIRHFDYLIFFMLGILIIITLHRLSHLKNNLNQTNEAFELYPQHEKSIQQENTHFGCVYSKGDLHTWLAISSETDWNVALHIPLMALASTWVSAACQQGLLWDVLRHVLELDASGFEWQTSAPLREGKVNLHAGTFSDPHRKP